MSQFTALFPDFILACAKLYKALVPLSLAVLVLSFAFEFWRGVVDVSSLLRFLTKLFLIILLTAQAHKCINSGQVMVEDVLANSKLVRSEDLGKNYKDRLAATFGQADLKEKSFWQLLVGGKVLDALLFGILLIVSFIALTLITFITFVQKAALLICWAVCPVLFACLAIPPLAHLGSNHLMRILAIVCWPLGFALAATFSDALIDMALNDRLLATGSVSMTLGAAIESLFIIAVVGFWSSISTLLAPAFIHRFLVGHSGCAQIFSSSWERLSGMVGPGLAAAAGWVIQHLRPHRSRGEPPQDTGSDPGVPPTRIVQDPPPSSTEVNPDPSRSIEAEQLRELLLELLKRN